ncbi:MAG: peptide/nickel transport system permease protein [Gaiellales bacterium]|jgi:peptide/nickel transport system permease protein|nr:peptide/nickel transport system permease protein [Gaiellales bacterium]
MSVLAARRGSVRERSPVLRFIGRRSLGALAGIIAASIVIFAGTQLLPGDAASVVLGRNGDPATVRALNARLHLDRPAVQQYTDWLRGFVHGDLGDSAVGLAQGAKTAPIWGLISNPVKNSVILALITALLMIPLSLGLGVLAAVYGGRWIDNVISLGSLAAISLPEFVIGSLLVGVFFVGLDVLPPVAIVAPDASPLDSPTKLILPIATLLLASLAAGIRMVRAGMLEVLQTEYVQTARLNGLSERRVLWRYGLRNALAPSVQILAQNLQWLIGGIIITENVFAYPGIGSTLVVAVQNRDVTLVQSVAMLIAIVYIALNLIADLIVMLLVPKIREPA